MEEIDLKYLEDTLKKSPEHNDVFKLLSVEAEPAVGDGENYVSKIYRLSITVESSSGTRKQYSVIMKRRIEMKSDIEEINQKLEEAFNKEYCVYANVLNKLSNFLLRNRTLLWANCLGTIPNKDIYFEDLKASGHSVSDRLIGLDFNHAEMVFSSLAEIHAASYMAIANGEIDITPYRKYLVASAADKTKTIKSNAYAMMVDVIRKEWSPEWGSIADRLEQVSKTLPDVVSQLGEIDETKINVFNHGDTWVNNFMFQYDSTGKPVSLKFVDFQISHYNTYAFDMCYFLNTSVSPDMKRQHLNSWIQSYCDTFGKCLDERSSDLPRPTPQTVRQELTRLTPFSLNISLRIRPIIMVPSEDSVPMGDLLKDSGLNSKKRKLYNNPNYIDVMKKDLPYLLNIVETINKINA